MKHIKDPVYGYIDVPDEELSIINHKIFQRLRRIKQLGLSSTVYPSATHSRFAHSLGVMKLSKDISESIGLSDEEVRLNQVAGLLHDIGHLPYSHTLESLLERKTGMTHEDISCQYIDVLVNDNSVNFPVDPDIVKDIIKGNYEGTNIVSNEIDADRIDYLIRDSHHTGIKLGDIEKDTLIKFSKQIDGRLGFNHKSLGSVENLLDSRMQMDRSVYSHNTVNITETILERSVENHIESEKEDMENLLGMYDYQLSELLINSSNEAARQLFNCIQNRNLYKTAYFDGLSDVNEEEILDIINTFENVREHESNIANIADIKDHKVLISLPRFKQIGEFKSPIETSDGEIKKLENVSPKPESLRKSQLINANFHIFTEEKYKNVVKKASKEYLDSFNCINNTVE